MTEKKDDNKKPNENRKRPRKPENPQKKEEDNQPPKKKIIVHFYKPVDENKEEKQDDKKDQNDKNKKNNDKKVEDDYKDIEDFLNNFIGHFSNANQQIWNYPTGGDDEDEKETVDLDDEEDETINEDLPLKTIDCDLETIEDLIKLGKSYDAKEQVRYNFDMKRLSGLVEPLEKLQAMIGMKSIKEMVFNHILFHLQGLEKENEEMKHATFEGNPGCGKTEVAKIMAEVYLKMGFLKNNKFIKAKRSDLIGKYLGHTAVQTQKKIDEAEGGVLFIDEAYSLGNSEQRDSFSKECIDTLTQNLDEKKKNFVCFIAGYPEKLRSDFFAYNPGLERRFPYRYRIDEYEGCDLMKIYKKKTLEQGWRLENEKVLNEAFFEKNRHYFKFNGGDIETLFNMTKIAHAKRVFGKTKEMQKQISFEDLEKGMVLFKLNDEVKNRNPSDGENENWKTLYN